MKNILYPKLTKYLDIRNIASRKGMGLSYGSKLLKKYLEKHKKYDNIYALKIDISKFFYTIDHDVLKNMLIKKLTTEEYELVSLFIDSTDKDYVNEEIKLIKSKLLLKVKNERQEREILEIPFYEKGKGLTIGNVSSQILSIFYLSEIDFYIINELKCKYMIRYCDDFIILHHDKNYLKDVFDKIEKKLKIYKLKINKKKSYITNIKDGVVFCGNLVKVKNNKTIIVKCSKNKNRIKRNLKNKHQFFIEGKISFGNYFCSVNSLKREIKLYKRH